MSKIQDRLREVTPFYDGQAMADYDQDCDTITEAADALEAAEIALGGAWYFISAFDRDNAPALLAEIRAALAKLEGAK